MIHTKPIPFVVVALLFAPGCGKQSPEAPAAPKGDGKAPAITIVSPQKKPVRRLVDQPGTVQADEQTQLFAKVPGYVSKVHVDIGQKLEGPRFDKDGKLIKPGTLLAEIAVPEMVEEAREKDALVKQAEAQVEQARKALAAAAAGVKSAEALVTEAKAGLRRAEAEFTRWESEAARVARLVKGGVIDAQTRDETQNQFRAAQASRDEAVARVASMTAQVARAEADRGKAEADVTAALAKVDVTRAAAGRLQALLGYTKIHAPYDGVVTRRRVNTGDYLQTNSSKEGIFTVARVDPVRIVVEVPETDAGLVREGSPAEIMVQSLESAPLKGTVTRTSWALEPGSRTLRVEVELPNKDRRLRPGMFVSARITAELPEALALPTAAVIKYGDGLVCYLVEDNKAKRVAVQVLRGDSEFTQVAKWEKPGTTEWVAFTGKEKVIAQAANVADGQDVSSASAGPKR